MGEAPASAKATANGDAGGEGDAAGASCAVGVALGDAGGVAAAAEEIAALEVGAAAGAGECEAVGSDSESDGDLDEECEEEVMLGFAERPRARAAMAAAYFPSKVGGEPAWLAPPTEGSVYCPVMAGDAVGGGHEATFHRTIFLFCCADGRCVAKHGGGACRALRGQLPRRNAHFSYEALPDPDTDSSDEGSGSEGGADASSWVRASEGGVGPSGQWPELELVVEPEEECLSNSASVEQLLQRYSAAEKADGAGQAHGLPAEAMPSAADLQFDPERRQWVSFQARCAAAPEQVLRHCRSTAAGAPLWPRKTPGAPRPPPACPRCGGERIFEYQVLPQLLHFMRADAGGDKAETLDFGTIAVYTCRANCELGDEYAEEEVFVQPPPE